MSSSYLSMCIFEVWMTKLLSWQLRCSHQWLQVQCMGQIVSRLTLCLHIPSVPALSWHWAMSWEFCLSMSTSPDQMWWTLLLHIEADAVNIEI